MNNNIVDSILQAIDIVSSKNVEDISFDQTIECEIVNVDDAKNGKYVVSDGSAKFFAYSEKTTYSKGDVVRVKILEGNYEKPKYIEGLVARDDNQPITYLSALNTILDVVDLTQETKNQKFKDTNKTGFGLTANKASEQVKLLWSFNFNDYPNIWLSGVYSSLFIEADFTTVLENVKKGTYGLFLRVGIKLDNGVITTKDYSFDSTEFFGNPYRFVISTNQAKKFNIKDFKQFETIALYFYQRNDFETVTGDRYLEAKASNLIVKNIRVGLGTDLAEIQDNSIKLVTLDPAGYYTEDDAKKNEYATPVNIDFLWFNKSEENKYIGFGDGIAKRKISKEFKEKFFEKADGTKKSCFGVSVSGDDSSGYTINAKNYNENSYLKAVAEETRLETWKNGEIPPDRESLEIMANIQDAHNALIGIRNLISQKYEPALNTFKNHMADNSDFIGDALNKYNINFTQLEKYISKNLTNSVTEASFLQYYKNLFKFISFVYYSVKEEPIDELKEIDRIVPETCINVNINFDNNYYSNLFQNHSIGDKVDEVFVSDSLELIKKKIYYLCPEDEEDNFEFENNIKNNHSNYLSFYNNFKLNLKTIKIEFDNYYDTIKNAIPRAIEITSIASIDDDIKIKNKSNTEVIDLKSIKITVANGDTTKTKDYNLDFYQGYTSSTHTDANKIIEWEKSDYSIFDNLYSIYWYRYVADYIDESGTDYFGEKDWQRIDKTYSKYVKNIKKPEEFLFKAEGEQAIRKNLGLPICLNSAGNQAPSINEDDIGKDEQHWNAKPLPSDLSTSLSVVLNPQNTTEKFRVVIVYNHESFVSNEDLVFTNLSHPNNQEKITANKIEIEHSTNSLEHYAVYDAATLQIINDKEAYLNREVQAKYEVSDGEIFDGYVYWYLPTANTQLDYDYSQMTDFIKEETLKTSGKVPTYTKGDGDAFIARKGSDGKTKYYKSADQDKILETSGEYCKIKIQESDKDVEVWVKKASCVISCVERNGKICFSKSISGITTQSDMDAKLKFPYRIKSSYDSNNGNNVISCELKKSTKTEGLKGEIGFTFSISGSNGTDYTLVIAPEYNSITSFCGTDNENVFYLNARVYDKNTDPIPIRQITLENYPSLAKNPYSFSLSETDDTVTALSGLEAQKVIIRVKLQSSETPSYAVLKARVKIDELRAEEGEEAPDIWLDALYPISWSDKEHICLSGPKQIAYNSSGALMNYDKTGYKLQNSQTQEIITTAPIKITNTDGSTSNAEGPVSVEILYLNETDLSNYIFTRSETTVLNLENYLPKLCKSNILIPAPLFVDNIGVVPLINFYCNDIIKVEETKADGTPVIEEQPIKRSIYKQPLVILQSRFESSLLNDWNGNLKIDDKGNYILTAMVGAGVKNPDNSFSGVLMGDMQKNGGSTALSKSGIGLYGIHEGAQSFGFNVDGTAFLGKSGKGRILFNGNYGTIASANWFTGLPVTDEETGEITYPNGGVIDSTSGEITNPSDTGMCIDLETGHIDAYNFKLTSKNIYFNSDPRDEHINNSKIAENYSNYYFKIGDEKKTGYIGLDNEGKLIVRVNELHITDNLGNENLLKQTSPRKTMLVPRWIKAVVEISSVEDITEDGRTVLQTIVSQEDKEVKALDGQEPVYIYDLSHWEKRYYVPSSDRLSDINPLKWEYNNEISYDKDTYVEATVFGDYFKTSSIKYQGNIWKCKNESGVKGWLNNTIWAPNPPGDNSTDWEAIIDVVESSEEKNYILETNEANLCISQSPKLRGNSHYTVSGYIKSLGELETQKNAEGEVIKDDDGNDIIISHIFRIILGTGLEVTYSNLDNEITYKQEKTYEITDNNWHYFRCTFKTPEVEDARTVGFTMNKTFQLWHAKLEEGTVATAWCPSPDDVEDNAESIKNQYDNYLNQDNVFNKLFTDPVTGLISDGIVKLSADKTLSGRPELYISATYISSGILRSKNWDGTLKSEYNSASGEYKYLINTPPKHGMYLNLNEGKMWASSFELNAWDYKNGWNGSSWDNNFRINETSGQGLYLNSDPATDGYYLKLGNLSTSYITFDASGNIGIRANSFYLTEALGGENLLKRTNPKKTVPRTKTVNKKTVYETDPSGNIIYDWEPLNDSWTVATNCTLTGSDNDLGGKTYYLSISSEMDTPRRISQQVTNLAEGKEYTISGYVRSTGSNFTIETTNSEASIGSNSTNSFTLENSTWTYFKYTFKLNVSSNSTTVQFSNTTDFALWHAKMEQGSVATAWCESQWDIEQLSENTKNKYDNYLAQDQIFKKLITDPTTGNEMVGIWLVDSNSGSSGQRKELYINATYIATGILRSNNFNGELGTQTITQKTESGEEKSITTFKITTEPTQGMYINMNEGKVWAANFELTAGTKGNTNFLGLYSVDQSATVNSTSRSDWRIIAGQKFGVTRDGTVYASSANISGTISAGANSKIGGWTIYGDRIQGGSLQLFNTGQITNTNGNFGVSAAGVLTSTGANLTNLNVTGTLTTTAGCTAKISGTLETTGNTTIGGNTEVTGTFITKSTVTLGGNTTVNGTLTTTGKVELGGDTTISGGLTLNSANFKVGDATAYSKEGVTIYIDRPWTGHNYDITIKNGIITGVTPRKLSLKEWLKQIFGGGTETESTDGATRGAKNQPIWLDDGNFTACSGTYGGNSKLMYVNGGKFTDSDKDLGSKTKPIYLDGGTFKECNSYPDTSKFLTSSGTISYAENVARYTTSAEYVTTQGTANYGGMYKGPTVSSLTTGSSLRFKNTVDNIQHNSTLYSLRPISYYYNDTKIYGKNLRYGFIAEEVLKIAPELVEMDRENPDLCSSIYYNSILTLAVAEIQKLRKELDEIKSNLNK